MQSDPREITIADYDYPLPDERIAKFPLNERDQSKLLVYKGGMIAETRFSHLPEQLPEGAMLLFNNTRVIHARLFFRKPTGSMIEIFCLEPWQEPVATAFEHRSHSTWLCFIGNNKKWKEGALARSLEIEGQEITLTATRRETHGDAWVVDFEWSGGLSFAELIEHAGVIPLPPYLHRDAEQSDNERYQTIYAQHEGSVAAPTAGLHFTDNVFKQLKEKGFRTEFVTLHVGAGTFKPVSTTTIGEHEMHVEKVQISLNNIHNILDHIGRPIITVGTTSVRTLESVYWFGVQLCANSELTNMHVTQWEPYQPLEREITFEESFNQVARWMEHHDLDILEGDTQLLIAPGYRYRVINGLITNFHQPKSTLLLLVSALIGEDWKRCYQYALEHDFRFLSYGDSCLFLPTAQCTNK
ncbi:MAG: S-adenosylmethionine:tRNA ribosyltransferase-isomerase [Bacteroidales bacterium]|nr:S-adenosylmethionine:tRNA ribosyltransferase-isomerase [Bacteroidales bacterium]